MNKKQKWVLLILTGVLLLMLLFPPFHVKDPVGVAMVKIENMGYHFIGMPPILERTYGSEITIVTLLVQYLFTITIGGILFFIFKDRE